jgi:hypothetical protein
MIFKILSPKNSAKKLAFLTHNKAKICKILIITLVFEKNVNFFAENWRKSQKIVIITSIPDWTNFRPSGGCLLRAGFFRNYRSSAHYWTIFLHLISYIFILSKNGLGHILGDFFTNSSGHPAGRAFSRVARGPRGAKTLPIAPTF